MQQLARFSSCITCIALVRPALLGTEDWQYRHPTCHGLFDHHLAERMAGEGSQAHSLEVHALLPVLL